MTLTFSISPELLIQLAVEEYDHLQAGNCNAKAAKEDAGVALSAQSSSVSNSGEKP